MQDPDDTIYVDTQVNIAQPSQAYNLKQSYCQELLPNMTIDTTPFQRYHQFTYKKSTGIHGIVHAFDTASDSPIAYFAIDASCNRRSEELAKVKFYKNPESLVPRIGLTPHIETFKKWLLRCAPKLIVIHCI